MSWNIEIEAQYLLYTDALSWNLLAKKLDYSQTEEMMNPWKIFAVAS